MAGTWMAIPTLVVSSLHGQHPIYSIDPVTGTMPLWRSTPGGPTTVPTGPTER